MKKLLLSLCLLFALSISSEAQYRPPHHRYRHHPRRTVVQPREIHETRHYNPIGELRSMCMATWAMVTSVPF